MNHRFYELVTAFADEPDITLPVEGQARRFGGLSLKVCGSIFAMLDSRGDLVVKLPKERVGELVASGQGHAFDPHKNGRVMKQWLVVDSDAGLDWLALAREAHAFVRKSNG